MKFFHLPDLHIGKQLNGYSLKENQKAVFTQIVEAAETHHPDAILICGDIYDKTVPAGEAYTLFEQFLKSISAITPKILILIIAGNHDSPERLAYASSFLEKHNIFISALPPQTKEDFLKKVQLEDKYGIVNFYLFPFIKPGYVRHLFEDGIITSYESAVKAILEREKIDYTNRNVLLSHQFYTANGVAPEVCESEQAVITVGGLDQIDCSVVSSFDYVALGHLHGPQKVGSPFIRYCGTPLKYSVSETKHKKSITMVTLGEKQKEALIETIPLTALYDVRKEQGTLKEILNRATKENKHDFIRITLTDEEELFHDREQLEEIYDHVLEIRRENQKIQEKMQKSEEKISVHSPFEAFSQFYETIRHCKMTEKEEKIMKRIIDKAKEGRDK